MQFRDVGKHSDEPGKQHADFGGLIAYIEAQVERYLVVA